MLTIKSLARKVMGRLKGRSMLIIKIVAALTIAPIALMIATWAYIWVSHDTSDWAQKMLNQLMAIVDHTTAPSVVAAIVAYSAKLVDNNKNGVPDELERGDKNEPGNNIR